MKRVTTSCPECGTSFLVAPKQLAVRQGQVRCGKCGQVFNALETIVLDAAIAVKETTPASATAVEITEPSPASPSADTAPSETPPTGEPSPSKRNDGERPGEEDKALRQASLGSPKEALPTSTPVPAETSQAVETALQKPPLLLTTPQQNATWLAASAILFFLLVAQFVYLYRSEIARDYPGAKPHLETICGMLGCQIALSKDSEQVTIEASDLQIHAERDREITLIASVRNRARFVQAYPALELTLTDGHDRPVARKILYPDLYLGQTADPKAGMPPNSETSIKLRFDSGELNPVGYRLMLFYP